MIALPLLLTLALQAAPGDVAPVRLVDSPPRDAAPGASALGDPSVRLATGQGAAEIWLLRTHDSAFVAARIPDSTYYWGDDLVISLDISGDRGHSSDSRFGGHGNGARKPRHGSEGGHRDFNRKGKW